MPRLFSVDNRSILLYNIQMTTNLSIVKAILDSCDSGNEIVTDAQAAVISFFISRDGFRNPELDLPADCLCAFMTLKDFIKHPEKYTVDAEDSAA